MVTTVQLHKNTKKDLLLIKARLEQFTGEKKSLDDAIKWLLEKENSSNFQNRILDSNECFGSISDLNITLDSVTELRISRKSRFADF